MKYYYYTALHSSDQQRNIGHLRELNCVSRLVYVIQDGDVSHSTLHTVANVLSVLLKASPQTDDLLV